MGVDHPTAPGVIGQLERLSLDNVKRATSGPSGHEGRQHKGPSSFGERRTWRHTWWGRDSQLSPASTGRPPPQNSAFWFTSSLGWAPVKKNLVGRGCWRGRGRGRALSLKAQSLSHAFHNLEYHRQSWVQIAALPFTSCVAGGETPSSPVPESPLRSYPLGHGERSDRCVMPATSLALITW